VDGAGDDAERVAAGRRRTERALILAVSHEVHRRIQKKKEHLWGRRGLHGCRRRRSHGRLRRAAKGRKVSKVVVVVVRSSADRKGSPAVAPFFYRTQVGSRFLRLAQGHKERTGGAH